MKLSVWRILELYHQGIITEGETLLRIIEDGEPDDIMELPKEWKEKVFNKINEAPKTDEEWDKLIFLHMGWCGRGMPPSQEECRREYKIRIECLRRELMLS